MSESVFEARLPEKIGQVLHWGQLHGCASSLVAQACAHEAVLIYVTKGVQSAHVIANELRFFAPKDIPIFSFLDNECLPYDRISAHPDIISQRLQVLSQMPCLKRGIVVAPIQAVLQKQPPRTFIQRHSFNLKVNDNLDTESFKTQLIEGSYHLVDQVFTPGEFAIRGGIIDVFPSGHEAPFRLDLFGSTIESIKYFDPETQRSHQSVEEVAILPANTFSLETESVQFFRRKFRENFDGNARKSRIYQDISNAIAPAGSECYLPLFHSELACLFDYVPKNSVFVFAQGVLEHIEEIQAETQARYENAQLDPDWPPLPPEQLFLTQESVYTHLKQHRRVQLVDLNLQEKHLVQYKTEQPKSFRVDPHQEAPYANFIDYCTQSKNRILLLVDSKGRQEHLKKVLLENNVMIDRCDNWHHFCHSNTKLAIGVGGLERGLNLPESKLEIICENQLYGNQSIRQRKRSRKSKDPDSIIRSLAELEIGDPIVHDEHGVGRYRGLESLSIGSHHNEFAVLEYAGGDKIYLPILSLELVSRYIGGNPDAAPLHKMGSDVWLKSREKAKQKAYDVAVELLELQALRAAREGHVFPCPDHSYDAFAAEFAFSETADQAQVIQDVIEDMTANKPMDRLVCGDVGFGKTEVALRAAFLAASGGKQVAMLVPTTLLAQQHFDNFEARFAKFPITIELLSRFKTKKHIDTALEKLRDGKIDIIIGTHKLLQKSVVFHNLGLLIIDEEHRFGVRQKEQLKKLRSQVDILTLTATPIPRTLNFALSGLRDISVIATPPKARLSVKTFVREWNDTIIKDAILREIRRGGQVYVLHNEVQTIEKIQVKLSELLPEARIQIGHGQMHERELEAVMRDFYHQRFNILLCTTIIESGIDVPTANTIIINRADRLGLAQLHQLRGRVGRSHHQAFAYMITPNYNSMSESAKKRLTAIEALDTLGASFALASQDLEIRGAGELLGESQSGTIDQVGYSMYNRYLEQAISDIKENKSPTANTPLQTQQQGLEINLDISAQFPESYIPNVRLRLNLYKRIASAQTLHELHDIQIELIDRFGLLPDESKNLIHIAELKLKAKAIDIHAVHLHASGGSIQFAEQPNIDLAKLMVFINEHHNQIALKANNRLLIEDDLHEEEARFNWLEKIIQAAQL